MSIYSTPLKFQPPQAMTPAVGLKPMRPNQAEVGSPNTVIVTTNQSRSLLIGILIET